MVSIAEVSVGERSRLAALDVAQEPAGRGQVGQDASADGGKQRSPERRLLAMSRDPHGATAAERGGDEAGKQRVGTDTVARPYQCTWRAATKASEQLPTGGEGPGHALQQRAGQVARREVGRGQARETRAAIRLGASAGEERLADQARAAGGGAGGPGGNRRGNLIGPGAGGSAGPPPAPGERLQAA